MARFTFKSASCVVVGSFNIHIFTPDWMVKAGALEEEDFELQFALTQPGFRIPVKSGMITWEISPNRVEVTSKDPTFDCGEVVARVLAKLPETPTLAIGTNVAYECPTSDLAEMKLCQEVPKSVAENEVESCSQTLRFSSPVGSSRAISIERSQSITKAIGNDEQKGEEASSLVCAAHRFCENVEALSDLLASAWGITFSKENQS